MATGTHMACNNSHYFCLHWSICIGNLMSAFRRSYQELSNGIQHAYLPLESIDIGELMMRGWALSQGLFVLAQKWRDVGAL